MSRHLRRNEILSFPPLVGQHPHLYLSVSPVIVDLAEPLAAAARPYRRTWGGLAVIPEEDEFIVIG